jgi:hypothetical protein
MMDEFELMLRVRAMKGKTARVDDGCAYSSYNLWAEKYKLAGWKSGSLPDESDRFVVLFGHIHGDIRGKGNRLANEPLVAIQSISTGQTYIIGFRGVEEVPDAD